METVVHEKLFDEICDKLNELSQKNESHSSSEKLEKLHFQLKKTQDELMQAQEDIQERFRSFDNLNVFQVDYNKELQKITDQLEQERSTNSKLSTDLARSLELNLKLQFEIEEIRTKAQQVLNEEKRHNQYFSDKNKQLSHELELAQALCNDMKLELVKAKDRFAQETEKQMQSLNHFKETQKEMESALLNKDEEITKLNQILSQRDSEFDELTHSLSAFENHSVKQTEALKNLSHIAEKKIVELKISFDKKSIEAQDYYSHLQQSLTQITILKQENHALKDYIAKLTNLHKQQTAPVLNPTN